MTINATGIKLDVNEPLYIIELGAGLGKFSFLFLNAIEKLRSTLFFPFEKIIYVMTDATKSNVNAWHSHPSLKPFFESGRLDVAIFNAAEDSSLWLHNAQIILKPGSSVNPVVIIANYLFDSLCHDVFQIAGGVLYAGRVSAGSQINESANPLNPDIISRMDNIFKFEVAEQPYYHLSEEGDESLWQGMLNWYVEYYGSRGQNATILFPVGALKALQRLSALSSNGAVVITADKGSGHVGSFLGLQDPTVAVDGSLSVMVNYHALSLWVNTTGGLSFVDPHEFTNLIACVFVLKPEAAEGGRDTSLNRSVSIHEPVAASEAYSKQYPYLLEAFYDHLVSFSPSDYRKLIALQQQRGAPPNSSTSILTTIALLRALEWDPEVFAVLSQSLLESLQYATTDLHAIIAEGLQLLWQNFFVTNSNTEIISEIGRIYGQMSLFKDAATFYERYLLYHPTNAVGLTNLGMCLYRLGYKKAAEDKFKLALYYRPHFELAIELLNKTLN
mmetsp:Transcript_33340/g.48306  ORF Transcript_33340/g.48306 Transcript_33340/m.48306 type:complete len:501 (+) Transcript_33340:378-1880(+)